MNEQTLFTYGCSRCCSTLRPCEETNPSSPTPDPSVFYAYPFTATKIEWIKQLSRDVATRLGMKANLPADSVDTNVLFCKICGFIRNSSVILSETTDLNRNVLFEHGFALANGLRGFLLVESGIHAASDLDVLRDIERIPYSNREDVLVALSKADRDVFRIKFAESGEPLLLGHIDLSTYVEQPGSIAFVKAGQQRTDALKKIEKLIRKSGLPNDTIDADEFIQHQLVSYCSRLKRASAVIGHFVSDKRQGHQTQNALTALLMGIAVGYGKRVLIFQERPIARPMIDLAGVLKEYETESHVANTIEAFIRSVRSEFARPPVRPADEPTETIEDPISRLDIGSLIAEDDDRLEECFIETEYYDWALKGSRFLIVGAKGAGKTAIFKRVASTLTDNASRKVIALEPSASEMEELQIFSKIESAEISLDLRLRSIWRLSLLVEISQRLLIDSIPGTRLHENLMKVRSYLSDELGIDDQVDFVDRFRTYTRLASEDGRPSNLQDIILKARSPGLAALLKPVLAEVEVRLLIDNLDKGWEYGDDVSRKAVLALVHECFNLKNEFAGRVKPTLFLRREILDVLRRIANEPDKWDPGLIKWTRPALKALLERRVYVAIQGTDRRNLAERFSWDSILKGPIHGQESISYILDRCLPRPRDAMNVLAKLLARSDGGKSLPIQESSIFGVLRESCTERLINLGREYEALMPGLVEVVEETADFFNDDGTGNEARFLKDVLTIPKFPWLDGIGSVRNLFEANVLCYVDVTGKLLASERFDWTYARDAAAVHEVTTKLPRFKYFPFFFYRNLTNSSPLIALHPAFRSLREMSSGAVTFRE